MVCYNGGEIMRRYILIAFLLIPVSVLARSKTSCDYSLIAKLRGLANNVNINYSYEIIDDKVRYILEFVNLNDDIYFIDNNTKIRYDNSNNIIISDYMSGKYGFTFYSNNSNCLNEKLSVKYVNLPYYNKYYRYNECNGIEDFNGCQKWIRYDVGYDDFLEDVSNYKKTLNDSILIVDNEDTNWFDDFASFFLTYYYIVMPIVIGLIIGIIYLVKYIKFKKNRFEI